MELYVTSITTEDVGSRVTDLLAVLRSRVAAELAERDHSLDLESALFAPIIVSPEFSGLTGGCSIRRDGRAVSVSLPMNHRAFCDAEDAEALKQLARSFAEGLQILSMRRKKLLAIAQLRALIEGLAV